MEKGRIMADPWRGAEALLDPGRRGRREQVHPRRGEAQHQGGGSPSRTRAGPKGRALFSKTARRHRPGKRLRRIMTWTAWCRTSLFPNKVLPNPTPLTLPPPHPRGGGGPLTRTDPPSLAMCAPRGMIPLSPSYFQRFVLRRREFLAGPVVGVSCPKKTQLVPAGWGGWVGGPNHLGGGGGGGGGGFCVWRPKQNHAGGATEVVFISGGRRTRLHCVMVTALIGKRREQNLPEFDPLGPY